MALNHPALDEALALWRSGRKQEGLAKLVSLAAANQPDALFILAEFYWTGGPLPQDLGRGRELLRRAGEAGHLLGAIGYTNLLCGGVAGERDWPGAVERLRDEASRDPDRARSLALLETMDLDKTGDPRSLPKPRELSDSPRAVLHPGAFTAEECDFLIATAEPTLGPSRVADGAGKEVLSTIRTSDDTSIFWMREDPATHALNRRIAAISGTGPEQAEPLLVLRYRPGQEYRPHIDWDGGENGRVITALLYLNDGYEGGETLFVKTGLKVKGEKGDVLVFHSTTPDGAFDPMSEHAGLPVTEGVKFLASRWIHPHRFAP
jgi:prolyl 4-hydroxylase